jgi:hypothetical protein
MDYPGYEAAVKTFSDCELSADGAESLAAVDALLDTTP